MPAPDGGDDFVGIGGPDEGLWAFVVFGKETVDGSLKCDQRKEDAAFETPVGQPSEEAFDAIRAKTDAEREGPACSHRLPM